MKTLGFRPVVYICSPFRGDVEKNIENARKYCSFAIKKKAIPFAPHLLYPQFMSEETDRELALFFGIVMLDKCAEVWVFGDKISEGMKVEIERAKSKEKKIRYFPDDLFKVQQDSTMVNEVRSCSTCKYKSPFLGAYHVNCVDCKGGKNWEAKNESR